MLNNSLLKSQYFLRIIAQLIMYNNQRVNFLSRRLFMVIDMLTFNHRGKLYQTIHLALFIFAYCVFLKI